MKSLCRNFKEHFLLYEKLFAGLKFELANVSVLLSFEVFSVAGLKFELANVHVLVTFEVFFCVW